ncbi:expressed unknown protein [Seminavis robusta]|uniref:Uncharacterized protein n=1 Tax=Seminavis robusta TaxID=568900 RepID=A0A9N8EY20_9STRA|nr:expressed unknown protein [Seminavis robusta]|eukprot:Sro2418_g326990.1 n/a (304) ;mRNA; r:3101-4012
MENPPTARGRSGRTERTVSPKASNNKPSRDIAKMRAHVSHPPMKSTSTRNLTKKKSSSTSSTTTTTSSSSSSKNRKSRSLSPTPKKIRALRRTWTMQNDADLSSCSATSASSCSSSCSFHTKIDIPAAPPGPPILKNADDSTVVVTRQRRRQHRRVEFDITEIREHAMILDEGNEDGPAMLTIDWECQNTTVTTVQEYYLERSMDRGPVRAMEPTERAAILIRAGGCMDVAYLTQNLALTESQHLCLTGTTTTTTTKHAKTLHPSCSGGGEKKKKGYFSKMKKAAKVAVYGKTPKEVNSTASQ